MQADAPVGILGLGLIGTAFSERLVGADIPVIGFDIDPARCEKLRDNRGTVAASARGLASHSRAIVIAVYSGAEAEAAFAELESSPARPAKSSASRGGRRVPAFPLSKRRFRAPAPRSGTAPRPRWSPVTTPPLMPSADSWTFSVRSVRGSEKWATPAAPSLRST